ncbi:MAG: hypothetical protein L0215_02235 [Gemmataceae bacterium]|nr:hypothetical protein [Gemmataceae bacterium]
MFRNRTEAGKKLAGKLKGRCLVDPLVLAVPRGGVVVGAAIAQELGADLDVVLARKLRAPGHYELALGALAEDGTVYLNPDLADAYPGLPEYLALERENQLEEIRRRAAQYRSVRPAAPIKGRSIVVTDDGIATGSTMIAALRALRAQRPAEVIVAVPVGAPDRLAEIVPLCDDIVCLRQPHDLQYVGQFYQNFEQVEDEEVLSLLTEVFASRSRNPNNGLTTSKRES